MIYTKPITEISWDDIEEFCQQGIPEGVYLDYKKDFPTHLEKTIAAMANTYGGIVLIGIDETDENKPVLPLIGIEFQRGLSERVTNIILTNITPPIFPGIEVCKNPSCTNAVVVIRIPQSHQTPHAVVDNTAVYLRTGNRNKAEKLANLEEIEWLMDGRHMSVDLRNRLLIQSEMRYTAFRDRVYDVLVSQSIVPTMITSGFLTLICYPTYPHEYYKNPSEINAIIPQISVSDYYGTTTTFPPKDSVPYLKSSTLVQDGVVLIYYIDDAKRIFYTEINSYGYYFYRQSIRRDNKQLAYKAIDTLNAGEIIVRIDEFIDSCNKFYRQIGYWGYLNLQFGLSHVRDIGLFFDWLRYFIPDEAKGISPDDEVVFEETILANGLEIEKVRIINEAMRKISWAFGLNFDANTLASFWKDKNR